MTRGRIGRLGNWLVIVSLGACLSRPSRAAADPVLQVGELRLDRPTLVTLGVQLLVSGDDNHDASVGVRYRVTGTTEWRDAMPLFRVRPGSVSGRSIPEQFAGSIFDLAPATSYDVELHVTDPDGPVDDTVFATASTRPVPGEPETPNRIAGPHLRECVANASPGDVCELPCNTYPGNFTITVSGTAENPIVIRGAREDCAILDGQGSPGCVQPNGTGCNVLDVYGSFIHLERLTIQNAERGIRFHGNSEGNVVRRVHIQNVRSGIASDPDQRDFYICDNVIEGRLTWPLVYPDDGGVHADDDGIEVEGNGHVVCHNRIVGFGDALTSRQEGARAIDFYGNDVLSAYDNGLELDRSEGNARALRNRFTNTYQTLSFQPIYGGPAYAVRNVVVNVASEQLKFHALGTTPPAEPSGIFVLHNTFVSPGAALVLDTTATSHHFRIENNIFVGAGGHAPRPCTAETPCTVYWKAPIDDGIFDSNGHSPDAQFCFGATCASSLAACTASGSCGLHDELLAAPIFANGLAPPDTYTVTMSPQDASLAAGSNAIDRAVPIANVNDRVPGNPPDLGALESGFPAPLFGVRPEGIDETNELDCAWATAGTVCRPAAGPCDVAETCDGTSPTCPPDSFLPSTAVCYAGSGDVCDPAKTCTGTAASCPAATTKSRTVTCRAAAGRCDVAERCPGVTGASCPVDEKRAAGTRCNEDLNPCTTDTCDGISNDCQHRAGNAGRVCRAAVGDCDVAETCTGTTPDCPPDVLVRAGTVCRPAVDICDVAETCSGTSGSCPADGLQPSSTVCRESAGACDVPDHCTGAGPTCPVDAKSTAVCRPGAGGCDAVETCDGIGNDCPPDAVMPPGSVCYRGSGDVCDETKTCTGTSVTCPAPTTRPGAFPCRSTGGDACDVAETCSGIAGQPCPPDRKKATSTPDGVTCDVANGLDILALLPDCTPDRRKCSNCRDGLRRPLVALENVFTRVAGAKTRASCMRTAAKAAGMVRAYAHQLRRLIEAKSCEIPAREGELLARAAADFVARSTALKRSGYCASK